MIKGKLLHGLLAIAVAAWMLSLAALCVAEPSQNISDEENCTGLGEIAAQVTGLSNASSGPNLAAPDLISPSGVVNTGKPTYTWKGVTGCIYYCLMVKDDHDKVVLKQWYESSDFPAAPKSCSATPLQALGPGDYKWSITSWNCAGLSLSSEMKFAVCESTSLPGKATLVSPNGDIGTKNPTFVWNAEQTSTRYCLKVANVRKPNAPIFESCYDAADVLTGQTCTVTPKIDLGAGSYRWWIQTVNCKGDGPWSDFLGFKYRKQLPGRSNPLSPAGLTASSQPTFTWTAACAATEYHLQIDGDALNVMDVWCDAADVTSGSRCSLLLPNALPDGDSVYFWRIQASNDAGNGAWSSYRYFEVVCPIKPGADKKLARKG